MKSYVPALAAACLALSASFAFAQAPAGAAGKGPGMTGHEGGHGMMMKPCSQESDPAKCEANRKQMRENMKAAHDACKDSKDKRGCMTEQYCAKSPDPAQCKSRAAERHAHMGKRMGEHQKAAEACTGKRGDELQKCYREQHEKSGGKPGAHDHGSDKK
jgi:Spy/CpxP family protein refolding chaperone